ncbi:hypothetical protein BT63DRAFT_471127 [Microthyrium microscopicum]|uniref:Uncharacterized protein n=1 Tax=Microthyrium microscopicum TaxID=703497 RepID=A0A6A6UDK7_9PEZI|nr:hypothetical protein BT63DRAFT_471127 [Microthyrium microscopicum]
MTRPKCIVDNDIPDVPTFVCSAGPYSQALREVNFETNQTDGEIFDKIRQQYKALKQEQGVISMFSKPCNAICIKRPLISRIAGSLEAPSMLPTNEVGAGTYDYAHCPIDDEHAMTSEEFLDHFYSSTSAHSSPFWGSRLPKVFDERLREATDQAASLPQGWGVQERPHWALFLLLMLVILPVNAIVAGVDAGITGDKTTGITIGSWLTAFHAMCLALVFGSWR